MHLYLVLITIFTYKTHTVLSSIVPRKFGNKIIKHTLFLKFLETFGNVQKMKRP